MGTQQLLLIVLSVIIVGIAVTVGISIFGSDTQQANADAVVQDCIRIASGAQSYYRKPAILGGGGCSFSGLTLAKCNWNSEANANGMYSLSAITGDHFTITGNGTLNTHVSVTVYADSISLPVITID